MSVICLLVAIVLFVLVGLEVDPAVLSSINLTGFGLAFFAASFLPWGNWRRP